MKLVVTPKPGLTESLMGYLLRLAEANGYPKPGYLLTLIERQWSSDRVGRLDALPLKTWAGITQAEADRLTLFPSGLSKAYVRLMGHDLPSYEVAVQKPKVCPLCVASTGQCEAFWDLGQAVACPVHRVMLLQRCPNCASPLRWSRAHVAQCPCGASICEWPANPAPNALSEVMGLMRHFLYQDSTLAEAPPGVQHLAHLGLRKLCKLLWVMSTLVHERETSTAKSKARYRYPEALQCASEALIDWPHGIRRLLTALYAHELDQAETLPTFGTHFSWLTKRLIANDPDGGKGYHFLAVEVCRFGAAYWTRGAIGIETVTDQLPAELFRWGSLTDASKILDMHVVTLRNLIRAGALQIRSASGTSTRSLSIDLHHALRMKWSAHEPMSIRAAAKTLGVSTESLKRFRETGVYQASHRPRFAGSFAREDVFAFREVLSNLYSRRQALSDQVAETLKDLSSGGKLPVSAKAVVIARIIERPDFVAGYRSASPAVEGIQILKERVPELVQGLRMDLDVTTVAESARRIGCAPQLITTLHRAGHLTAESVEGVARVRCDSLDRFCAEYVPLAVLVRGSRVCYKRAYARVDFSKFRHIRVQSETHSTVFIHRSSATALTKDIQSHR